MSGLTPAYIPPLPCDRRQVLAEVYRKRVGGANLISMVNSERLGEDLGIARLDRAQLLWNLEVSNNIDYPSCSYPTAVDG